MSEQRLYNIINAVCTVITTILALLKLHEIWEDSRWPSVWEGDDDDDDLVPPADPFAPSAADMRALHDFTR